MTEEKKKQLFPYFAYLYSQELNPEKYGAANSIEEWTDLIQNSPEDINEISAAASELTDEDWDQIEQQYAQAQTEGSETATAEEIQSAKKGAKLKKLQEFKTGGKSKKKKKCACGCEMISKKEKGGQLVDVCSCCGKTHKFQYGGVVKYEIGGMTTRNPANQINLLQSERQKALGNIDQKTHSGQMQAAKINDLYNKNIQQWQVKARKTNVPAQSSKTWFAKAPERQDANLSYHSTSDSSIPPYRGPRDAFYDPVINNFMSQKDAYKDGDGDSAFYINRQKQGINYIEDFNRQLQPTESYTKEPAPQVSQATQVVPAANVPATAPRNPAKPKTISQSDRLTSIVDYLNAEGMNSSFGNRRQLAAKLGIQNYIGSGDQNKRMIELLQAQRQQDLAQAKIATPSLAPTPVTATLPPITPTLTTMLASRKKGGNIKKAQKGTKTKEGYIGNNETWDPKSVGTGDSSMNPKD